MWGVSYSIYGLGQGSSHERVRLKQGLEEIMLAKLILGDKHSMQRGSQLVQEEDGRAVGKEVIE